jgi:hypothetical protein
MLAVLSPWWMQTDLLPEVIPLSNKRRRFPEDGSALLLFFLVGLRGEGEDGVFGRAAMLGKWSVQVVHVCQDQNLHPLRGVEEEHHIRPALSPSAAAPRVSHVYLSSRDAEVAAGFNTEDQVRIDAQFVFAIFMSLGVYSPETDEIVSDVAPQI